jgi:hypothetical protein
MVKLMPSSAMKKIALPLVCMVLLIAVSTLTGCTSTAPSATPAVTPAQPAVTAGQTAVTAAPSSTAESTVAATATTAAAGVTTTTAVDPVTVTINSATEKTTLAGLKTKKEGNVFLVLDMTLRNNDRNEDFSYGPGSFQLKANAPGSSWNGPVTTVFTSGLDHQLTSGTIPLKSAISGQIVFSVSPNVNSFRLTVSDAKGTVVTTVDNIQVS